MTNIFQRIGNNIEKQKEKKRKANEKYWKLSTLDRIDYDNKLKSIQDRSNDYPLLSLTKFIIGIFFFVLLWLSIIAFGQGYDFYKFMELIRPLASSFGRLIGIVFLCDCVMFLFLIFSKEWSVESKIKQLNKRFKLC
jgi:hypothetical protein